MKNGRGPWAGIVNVVGQGACQLRVGLSTDGTRRAYGHCIVALTGEPRHWSWTTDDPVVCETVASILESMGEVTPAQLEGIGFVPDGWEKLGTG
jgi:hypothetical protein